MERESPAERERIATSISNAEYHVVPTKEEEERRRRRRRRWQDEGGWKTVACSRQGEAEARKTRWKRTRHVCGTAAEMPARDSSAVTCHGTVPSGTLLVHHYISLSPSRSNLSTTSRGIVSGQVIKREREREKGVNYQIRRFEEGWKKERALMCTILILKNSYRSCYYGKDNWHVLTLITEEKIFTLTMTIISYKYTYYN